MLRSAVSSMSTFLISNVPRGAREHLGEPLGCPRGSCLALRRPWGAPGGPCLAHRSPRGGPGGCVHAIGGPKGGPKTRQRKPLGAAKACMIANDDGKTNVLLMIFKHDVFRCVFQRRAPGGGGCPVQKNGGFPSLRVPGGSLGGMSSRLVCPWGLQKQWFRFFLAAGGSAWSGQGMYPCKLCV